MPLAWMPDISIEGLIAEEERRRERLKQTQKEIVDVLDTPSWKVPDITNQPPEIIQQPVSYNPDIAQAIEQPQWEIPQPQYNLQRPIPQPVSPYLPQETGNIESPITSPDKALWEQPAVWTNKGQEILAQGISKVPLLPNILKWTEPGFTFVQEKLEKPWASIITAPWSPSLPWKSGESWIDHQKREYDMWKAPTYIKGAAEFSMPLWWLPWFGWAAKGARTLGIGQQTAKTIASLSPKSGELVLPTTEVLNTLYKPDAFRTIANMALHKPVIGSIVKAIGGESAFVKAVPQTSEDIVRRSIVNNFGVIRGMGENIDNLMRPRLQQFGDATKVLDIKPDGLVGAVTPKTAGVGRYLNDVLEHPADYTYASKTAENYVTEFSKIITDIRKLEIAEGLKPATTIHRIVKGVIDKDGKFVKSKFGSDPAIQRSFEYEEDAVREYAKRTGGQIVYGTNPNAILSYEINRSINRIANKRFVNEVKDLGKTAMEKFNEIMPDEAGRIVVLQGEKEAAKFAAQTVQKVLSYKGTTIPSATLQKIKEGMPDVAQKIDQAFSLAPGQTDRILNSMSIEMRHAMKVNQKDFNVLLNALMREESGGLAGLNGKISLDELSDAFRRMGQEETITNRAIESMYKEAYRLNKKAVTNAFDIVKDDIKTVRANNKDELDRLLAVKRGILRRYAGREKLDTGERIWTRMPLALSANLKGKFFPDEVVTLLEKNIGQQGNKWVRDMGQIGASSRLLTATMDLSAPFIQGLQVLGRNPVVWAKSVGKMFDFLVKPQNLTKYLTDPANHALHTEMVSHGASLVNFEFFEAAPAVGKLVEKIPVVGTIGGKVFRETVGRAEATFLGFGQVARDNMWKSLRKASMNDTELMDLARSLDRMTGVMSTEALLINRTQRDFENAWVFFAPRYTRATMSYVADIFKGGMSGAEARKAIGGLAAGGLSMYFGVCYATGQKPNLDPTSGKFMTIKVGNSDVGVGGMMYSLTRLGANIATVESLADLIKIDRVDNPFLSFMYSKSAPLTGTLVGILEQKNFLGQPFESAADWGRFLADKVTPIAFQSIMPWEEQKATPMAFLAQEAGLREFPKSPSQLRDEARNRYAMQLYQTEYKNLPRLQQMRINESPDIVTLQEETDIRTMELGNRLGTLFIERKKERQDAKAVYIKNLNKYQKVVDNGVITPYDFREYMSTERERLGATYEHIDRLPRYKEVIDKLNNLKNINPQHLQDIAYDELMEATYGDKFDTPYGLFDYDAYNQFKDDLKKKYGDDIYQLMLERINESRKDLPPLAQEYYYAQEVLKPYWNIQTNLIKLFGQRYVDSPKGQSLMTKLKKTMRLSNPEVDKYIKLFYTQP